MISCAIPIFVTLEYPIRFVRGLPVSKISQDEITTRTEGKLWAWLAAPVLNIKGVEALDAFLTCLKQEVLNLSIDTLSDDQGDVEGEMIAGKRLLLLRICLLFDGDLLH